MLNPSIGDTLHFALESFDDDDGVYYVVSGVEIALVTDGPTIEEALRNLRAAVDLYFEGDDLPTLPQLEVTFAVTEAYA
jgi:predicted RNase H-like HicB family nuclease